MASASRLAIVAIVLALLIAASGCGDGSENPRSRTTAGDLRDLERQGVDKLSEAEIERVANVRIPASATELRSSYRSAMDTQLLVSFRIPAKDLDAFVASGSFRSTLRPADRAIATTVGEEIGWRLGEAERVEGLAETSTGRYRNLVVVLDDPQRPAVHLEVGTL